MRRGAARSGAPVSDERITRDRGLLLAGVIHRNVNALRARRAELERARTRGERVADAITRFCGRMMFVYVHAALVVAWFLINTRVLPIMRPFDPYPFVMLAMAASVEAIFLSTFVLISQNRISKTSTERDELDLQIDLLAEHEITKLIELTEAIARKLDVDVAPSGIAELKQDVAPEAVLSEIERESRH